MKMPRYLLPNELISFLLFSFLNDFSLPAFIPVLRAMRDD